MAVTKCVTHDLPITDDGCPECSRIVDEAISSAPRHKTIPVGPAATAEIERLRGEVERLREFELAVERFAAMAQRFRQSAHECVIDGDAVSCSVAARLFDYARTIDATIEPDCCCGQRPNECVCGCYEGEDWDE